MDIKLIFPPFFISDFYLGNVGVVDYVYLYNKVTGCLSICLFVPKDLANH